MTGSRLAALVVTYNRADQIARTVAALLASDIDHLLVVDNASGDGSTDFLAGIKDPRLTLLRLAENRGGAGGFEAGLRHMTATFDPDWCVVMDDDARPAPDCIARFRAELSSHTAAGWEALAAGVFYPDGAICEMNRPSRNPFWDLRSFVRTLLGGGRAGFHLGDTAYDSSDPILVHNASFVGLFLSRQAIARAGYPEGGLFIYGDDLIYTLHLSKAGGKIGFLPWLRFEHDCSTFHQKQGPPAVSEAVLAEKKAGPRLHHPLWKAYYAHRNGLFAYRLAAGPVWFWPVLLVVAPKWMLKARAYGPDGGIFLRLLALALRDALMGRRNRPHAEIVARAANQGRGAQP